MAYIAQPSPIPTTSSGASASWTSDPQPAPAPSVGSNPSTDWNTQWNTLWNQSWNAGFSGSPAPTADSSFSSAISQGYSAGQQAKAKSTTTSSTPTSSSPVPTPQAPPSSTPDVGGQTNDIMNEINNLYGQSNDLFNQQESALNTQKTNALSSINAQGGIAKGEQKSALEEALNSAKTQINSLDQSKQSASNEALRSFNALTQSNQARFGTGSSAGGAISEIVSQEFLRNQGNIRTQYSNAVSKVYDFEQKANQTYQLAVQKLEQDIADKISAVNDSFTQGLLQISAMRVQNEQAKSQAKIQLMQDSLANARAIQNYKIENQIQLETWLQQQKTQSASALQYAKELATQAETNSFSSANSIQNINQSTLLGANNGNAIANIYTPSSYRTNNKDDYTSSLNPWLS